MTADALRGGVSVPAARFPRLLRAVLSDGFVLLLCLVYAAAAYPFVPEIATREVLSDMLSDMMPLLIVAIGQTFVVIVAGIDLSVTAIASFASVIGAAVMTGHEGVSVTLLAIAAMLLVGVAIGALNGLATVALNMPSFIVTLATRMFFAGAAIWFVTFHSTSSSIADLPDAFTNIADSALFTLGAGDGAVSLPTTVAIAGLVAALAHVALRHTVFGRRVYAVGINARAAGVAGVPVAATILATFVISGACAGLAAMIYTSRIQTGSPITGENILLDVIGAVVIGGTSLFGGRGKIVWTVFGTLFLVLLDTTMKLLGASLFTTYVIKGGVILAAAGVDTLRTRLLARA